MKPNSMFSAAILFAVVISSCSLTYGQRLYFDYDEKGEIVSASYSGDPGELESLNVQAYQKLDSLRVSYFTTLNQSDLNHIAKISQLEELIFGQDAFLGETVTLDGDPSVLRSLKNLRSLKLAVTEFDETDWDFLAQLPTLETLEIDASEYFDATACRMTDAFGKKIGSIPSLLDLWISHAEQLTDLFLTNLTEQQTSLECLVLTGGEFTDDGLNRIAQRLSDLERLEIGGERISDQGIKNLRKLKRLRELEVQAPNLTSRSVGFAADIGTLEVLQLDVSSVEEDDFEALCRNTSLQRLILRQLSMDDERFALLKGHPTLVSLFCDGSQLDRAKAIQIVQSLPKIEHISVGRTRSPLQQALNRELKQIKRRRKTGEL